VDLYVSAKVSEHLFVPIFHIVYEMKTEAVGRTEMLVLTYKSTRRHIPIDCSLHYQQPSSYYYLLPTAKFVLLLATKLVTADTFPPYVLVFHMQSHSDDDEHTHTVTKAKDSSSLNRQDRHQIPFPHRKSPSSTVTIKAVHLPTKLHRVTSHTTFAHTAVRT